MSAPHKSSPSRQRGLPHLPAEGEEFTEEKLMEFLEAAMRYGAGPKRLVHCLNPECRYFGLMIWTRDVYVCPCCGIDQKETEDG